MLPRALLLSFPFPFILPVWPTQVPLTDSPSRGIEANPLTFHLRHVHASNSSHTFFTDVSPAPSANTLLESLEPYAIKTRMLRTHRPSSYAAHSRARRKGLALGLESQDDGFWWQEDEVAGPDITSRETLLLLAKMTNNAYAFPDESRWYDLGDKWNVSFPFGWEDDADGFRGHVFATTDNSTVVISIKGTSAGVFGGGGPTAAKDRLNDNLLFSCCCAKIDWTWAPVCGCYAGGNKCDISCIEASLVDDSLFYPIGTNLYNNVSYMYPDSTIWVIGHSLGGALASLVGVTFGAPVVTFEAPGEKMAAQRLHLPSPPSTQHVTHVYHTADPVAMGTCTGVLSTCAIAGYAMESRCHLGKSVVYDTVTKWKWGVDIRTHPIKVIIDQLLAEDWDKPQQNGSVTDGKAVPAAKPEEDCVECFNWEYGDFIDPSKW